MYNDIPNLWYKLLQLNYNLFSEDNKIKANYYQNKTLVALSHRRQHVNFFGLDGRSYETICDLVYNLYSKKSEVVLPNELRTDEPALFFNDGEGHSPSELFDALHKLIDVCKLTGMCRYENSSVNVSDIYEQFCRKRTVLPKMTVGYSGNPAFFDPNNVHYKLPQNLEIEELPHEQKKLYCSFNWNPWEHRLGLIAILHYYDLIKDGHVTSPGRNKYAYNPDSDFKALEDCNTRYLQDLDIYHNVLNALPSLRNNYPLKIDDRSQYKDTDTPLMDEFLKLPLYKARLDSLFEIITETRFTYEHWFSEKTYWPIKVAKPFLIINGMGCLKSLRKLGFKTYGDYIDESYDDEPNVPKKIHRVVLELKRLRGLRQNDPNTFNNIYSKMKEIALHNSEVFNRVNL